MCERVNANGFRYFNGNNGTLNGNNAYNRNRVQAVANLLIFGMNAMTEEELFSLIVRTMYDTRANKRYGRDSMEFERDWAPLLFRMYSELVDKSFRVDHNYAFLVSVPKWREIFATSFQGRMADHLLCGILHPYAEEELHPRTFNNRIGRGSMAAINQVVEDICEVSEGYTKPCRIIKWDLKGFFPNASCDYIEKCFNSIISKYASDIAKHYGDEMPAFLKWLTMVSVHCNPAAHCELKTPRRFWAEHIKPSKSLFTKPEGIGAPIGRMVSQEGMGLYINDEVGWLNNECGVRTTVFMDDGVMVVPEHLHGYALSLLPELRRRFAAKSVQVNDRKFYDQPYQHGLEFLGYHIKPYRLIVNDGIYKRCYARLGMFDKMAAKDKYRNLEKFIATANSYFGMMKNGTNYRRIHELVNRLSGDWWQWLYFDAGKLCLNAKPGYALRDRLKKKYHLKLHNYEARRKRQVA